MRTVKADCSLTKVPNINVKVVLTESAYFFVKDEKIDCPIYREQDEWNVNIECFYLNG
jgi:hypothetical protein